MSRGALKELLALLKAELAAERAAIAQWNRERREEGRQRRLAREAAGPAPRVKGHPGKHGPLQPGTPPQGNWRLCGGAKQTKARCEWCGSGCNSMRRGRFLFQMLDVSVTREERIANVCRTCSGLTKQEAKAHIKRYLERNRNRVSANRLRR